MVARADNMDDEDFFRVVAWPKERGTVTRATSCPPHGIVAVKGKGPSALALTIATALVCYPGIALSAVPYRVMHWR